MPKQTPVIPQVFQLKITVRGLRPPIWRRLLVSSDTDLGKLHQILQVLMGWADYHLHQFTAAGREYSLPMFQLGATDERRVKLGHLITGPNFGMEYEYDFGDSWEIAIVVEKILPFDDKEPLPRVIAGKRAGPLEDSGGPWGYADLVRILKDPSDPEYAERMEWIFGEEWQEEGAVFDAEKFDMESLNKELSQLR